MRTWITSDLHFGHKNIMKFCPQTRARFNDDVAYMNNAMVLEWNAKVQPEDTVYILGDVAFMPASNAAQILRQLNGTKILIEGNHDHKNLRNPAFRSCFEAVHIYYEIYHNNNKVVMFHYPILEWNKMHYGSVHLFGHVHGKVSGLEPYRARDAGFDATDARWTASLSPTAS